MLRIHWFTALAAVAFLISSGVVGTVLYGIHSEGLYKNHGPHAPAPTPLRRVQ